MTMGRRILLAAATSAVATAAISVAATASSPVAGASGKLPLLISNCAKAKLKPANVILSPTALRARTKTAPIQLRLSKPVKCSNGKQVFAKVRFTWTQGAPSKFPDTGSVPLGCKLF
jgi:hypothetical protein